MVKVACQYLQRFGDLEIGNNGHGGTDHADRVTGGTCARRWRFLKQASKTGRRQAVARRFPGSFARGVRQNRECHAGHTDRGAVDQWPAAFHRKVVRQVARLEIVELVGLGDDDLSIGWDDAPTADILRWRRFGWAAWHGSVDCPYCNSSLKALRYDLSWWVFPRIEPETGRTVVEVPCPRCDPWTPKKVYEIEGPEAQTVLRKILAYQHITGATEGTIRDASRVIESVGSSEAFEALVTKERRSLWGMGKTHSIALEIAVNEGVERRMMELELQAIEFMWKREEELASIIDEQLTPDDVRERHYRRLPVTVLPR